MPHYFLGMDVGSTKTHAIITDENGIVAGFGKAGAGNHESVGNEGSTAAMLLALNNVLDDAGLTRDQIAGAGFGVAGYDWPSEYQMTLDLIAPLGLTCPLEAVNDATLGIIAGCEAGWGLAVVSGTGCNCRGRDQYGREGTMTGWGLDMGEGAGAGELVQMAVRAVAMEITMRGPKTRLSDVLAAKVGAKNGTEFIEGICTQRWQVGSDSAPLVFQVAEAGDPVAQELILWAGRELGSMCIGVIRQLNIEAMEFDIVMLGSTFNGSPMMIDSMKNTVRGFAPQANFVRLDVAPVAGAVLLGMAEGDLDITDKALRRQLKQGITARLAGKVPHVHHS